MNLKPLLFSSFFLFSPLLSFADCTGSDGQPAKTACKETPAFYCKVIRVIDGNIIKVICNRTSVIVRMANIYAPEKGQPFWKEARQFVSGLCLGQEITLQKKGTDLYGRRMLGVVILPDGRNLNREMVRAGLAWHYKQYSSDETLASLENEARADRRGLWIAKYPVAPWKWKKGQGALQQRRKNIIINEQTQ